MKFEFCIMNFRRLILRNFLKNDKKKVIIAFKTCYSGWIMYGFYNSTAEKIILKFSKHLKKNKKLSPFSIESSMEIGITLKILLLVKL